MGVYYGIMLRDYIKQLYRGNILRQIYFGRHITKDILRQTYYGRILRQIYYGRYSTAYILRKIYYGRYIMADISWQIYLSNYMTADILRQIYYSRYITADVLHKIHDNQYIASAKNFHISEMYSARSSRWLHPNPSVATHHPSEPRDLPDSAENPLRCAQGTHQATLSCILGINA